VPPGKSSLHVRLRIGIREATEDAGARDSAGLEVVHRGGVLIDVGWKLMS
jgi:hypothetical protein